MLNATIPNFAAAPHRILPNMTFHAGPAVVLDPIPCVLKILFNEFCLPGPLNI